jgi:hypothetical protein
MFSTQERTVLPSAPWQGYTDELKEGKEEKKACSFFLLSTNLKNPNSS